MIKTKVAAIRKQIQEVCQRINRNPNTVEILAATKNRSIEQIESIFETGITTIGENRVQEFVKKLPNLPKETRIDFIGHLQSNKVKDVIQHCELIHSVDSIKIARQIDRECEKLGKKQKILLEVNVSGETSKHGFKLDTVEKAANEIIRLKNISVQGLMTMAPHFQDSGQIRPIFRTLKELRDKLEVTFNMTLPELSMGMSSDYEIAIEEGATIIRLGRILFDYSD